MKDEGMSSALVAPRLPSTFGLRRIKRLSGRMNLRRLASAAHADEYSPRLISAGDQNGGDERDGERGDKHEGIHRDFSKRMRSRRIDRPSAPVKGQKINHPFP
jgi:hypothetical protein